MCGHGQEQGRKAGVTLAAMQQVRSGTKVTRPGDSLAHFATEEAAGRTAMDPLLTPPCLPHPTAVHVADTSRLGPSLLLPHSPYHCSPGTVPAQASVAVRAQDTSLGSRHRPLPRCRVHAQDGPVSRALAQCRPDACARAAARGPDQTLFLSLACTTKLTRS